jgi:hypothetical protein
MWPRVVGPAGGSTRTGRNEDDGVLSGPLGDSSKRDGREHLASEHLVNVPHGGVREAPPPIFTAFGKIRRGFGASKGLEKIRSNLRCNHPVYDSELKKTWRQDRQVQMEKI